MPDVTAALGAIPDADARNLYLQKALERVASDLPTVLVEPAIRVAMASISTADLIPVLSPADALVIQMAWSNPTRKGETVKVNGRKVKLSAASANILRSCAGASEVLADDRKVAALMGQLPELAGELVKDAGRARMGHSYYYAVSKRLSSAVRFLK